MRVLAATNGTGTLIFYSLQLESALLISLLAATSTYGLTSAGICNLHMPLYDQKHPHCWKEIP